MQRQSSFQNGAQARDHQLGSIVRAPLSNLKANTIHQEQDSMSVSSKRSTGSRRSASASRARNPSRERNNLNMSMNSASSVNSAESNNSRYRLQRKPNDTMPNSRRSRIPRAASNATKASQLRAAHTQAAQLSSNGSVVFEPFADTSVTQSIEDMKQTRAEAQQKRLEWAKKRAQAAEGDIVRSPDFAKQNGAVESGVSTFTTAQSSPNANGDETIPLTRTQLEQIIQDRIQKSTAEYRKQISQQEKQIDDLKFFQELDLDKTANAKDVDHSLLQTQMQAQMSQLKQLQLQNQDLNNTVTLLKEQNIDYQAKLQAANPSSMSSPDAYKKALRLQSDLLDAKNLLQEEVLRRERAETNLEAHKMEAQSEMQKSKDKIEDLEKIIGERTKDLDDGVSIMKSIEEEMEGVQKELEEEKRVNSDLQKEFEKFEEEKNELAEKLGEELEKSKMHLQKVEERFDNEKLDLEEKCLELQDEVHNMKEKVLEMEDKKKLFLEELKAEHELKLDELRKEKEEKATEAQTLQSKIDAMEEVVSMYHEKAKGEIQEYAKQAEEANAHEMEAREQLQECLFKVEEAEKEIESLLKEIEFMKQQMDLKESDLKEVQKKNEVLNENLRSMSSAKSKEHQHMRDKKKWAATEKLLRDELKSMKEEYVHMAEEMKTMNSERDGLTEAFKLMEEENNFLNEKVNIMEFDLEKVCDALESVEEESSSRIKGLEQELVRAQNSVGPRVSPSSMEEVSSLKQSLRSKDAEIRQLREMANQAMDEVQELKKAMTRSVNTQDTTPRINNFGYGNDMDANEKRALNIAQPASSSQDLDLEWDEMDNMHTSGISKSPDRSRTTPGEQTMAEQRRSIQNDAIRSYMRHRRRSKR